MPNTNNGLSFRVSTWSEQASIVLAAGGVEVLQPNIWRVQVHAKAGSPAAIWNRSDLGDDVHALMTIEQVAEVVDTVAARAVHYGLAAYDTMRCSAFPTFTHDGNWRWSGKSLTPGSIAHTAWQTAVA